MNGPVEEWKEPGMPSTPMCVSRGYDDSRKTFVQVYGEPQLDASLLFIPSVGFLPPSDSRVVLTIEAIERELMVDGFVKRYDTGATEDGMPPGEGSVSRLQLLDGRCVPAHRQEARRPGSFERLLTLCNDVGLLSEEYDVAQRRQVGNFPQAFSHIALVNSAHNLTHRDKPSEQRGKTHAIQTPGEKATKFEGADHV